MRISVITALCTGRFVLATLQADVIARSTVEIEATTPNSVFSELDYVENSGKKGSKDGQESILAQGNIDEIIIIWVNNGGGAATSILTATKTVTEAAGGSVAPAATHQVTVGGTAGLVYSPESIEAAIGDMVVFTFESQNHTVTQSAFTTPCEKLSKGMDSGFMPNMNNTVVPAPQVAMQVTVSTPLWFYCRQKGHCGKGMAFSINPTANKTQAMFKQMAIAQNGTNSETSISSASDSTALVTATTARAAASVATSASSAAAMATGIGTLNAGGACECACLCGTAAFPAAVQGLGAFGGFPGAVPMSSLGA